MDRALAVALLILLTANLSGVAVAYPRPVRIVRLSDLPKSGGGAFTDWTAISAGGRYVVYEASIDLGGPTGRTPGLLLHDVKTGKIELATVDSVGTPAGPLPSLGFAINKHPGVSANGRYVVFHSNSPTLDRRDLLRVTPGDDQNDVFLRDVKEGKTRLLSVGMSGRAGNSMSYYPSISADGRFVAFLSLASDLVTGDTNDTSDVFLYDTKTDKIERVSVASDGTQADGDAVCASVSDNGRYVVFDSNAGNFAPDDLPATIDVFVHDTKTGVTELVSRDLRDAPAGGFCVHGRSISNNGRFVVFWSGSNNLVPNDTNTHVLFTLPANDIFVFDRKTDRMERVSVTSAGVESSGGTEGVHYTMGGISADGRFVMFESYSNEHVAGDTEGPPQPNVQEGDLDVLIHDRLMGTTSMLAVDPQGREGKACFEEYASSAPSMSASGRYLAFASCSNNLVAGDDNQNLDYFHRDMGPPLGAGSVARGSDVGTQVESESVLMAFERRALNGAIAGSADIIAAKVAYRATESDLYLALDVEEMPGPWGAVSPAIVDPGLLYGYRFTVRGVSYEVRAQKAGTVRMGLFRCTASRSDCVKVADLLGGYGTTGERVLFSVPLSRIGLRNPSGITEVEAFTAVGSYDTGAAAFLDTLDVD